LPEEPPVVTAEANERLRTEERYEVETTEDLLAFCPASGHVPYELLIASERAPGGEAFRPAELRTALTALRSTIRRLRAVEGPVPWNAWLHTTPGDWHIEVVPRLTVFAALELGAGIYVNPLPPEEAASRLREAVP
jgi:UDPglucose--hexose-1-phosphate uridylyltransferase